jgi:hypothetical protein
MHITPAAQFAHPNKWTSPMPAIWLVCLGSVECRAHTQERGTARIFVALACLQSRSVVVTGRTVSFSRAFSSGPYHNWLVLVWI